MNNGIKRAACIACAVALGTALSAFADDIEVARQALRDGLWEIARSSAERAGVDKFESRVVIAESYAREKKWAELLAAVESWENANEDALVYYRALALLETGKGAQAEYLVSGRKFADPSYARLATRIRARAALASGGAPEALRIVKSEDAGAYDEDSAMFAAGLMASTGDAVGATNVWNEVVSRGTNASEKAYVTARVNLGDAKLLKDAYEYAVSAEMKRLAGYAYGKSMLRDDATFTNGVALVRSLVRDAPDAPGARGGLAAVARAYLDHGRAKESVAVYREIFDTWPDSVKSFELQYGLGSALRALGSYAEALEVFSVAEECAATDEERARAMVEQGNVLGESGKKDEMHAKFRTVLSKYSASEAAAGIKDIVRCRELEEEGRSLYGEYRFAEAQEKFREVAEKYPAERPRMEFFEVMCLYGQGLDDEAKKRAESIASGSSDREMRARATLWLAKLSYNGGDWPDARRRFADYAAMAPKAPDAPEAIVWSARAAFAAGDFDAAIQTVTNLAAYTESPSSFRGFLVQGEALIELARFDEAVLVLERTSRSEKADAADRLRAKLLRADALFAMGADNPQRYQEALSAYNDIALGESLDPSQKLSLAYKVARTLEKMKRSDEWEKGYYEKVVLEYRKGRAGGTRYNDEARAAFSRAAFRLADEYESRGRNYEARRVLELVATSDVPAAAEAAKRIDRIMRKERFL